MARRASPSLLFLDRRLDVLHVSLHQKPAGGAQLVAADPTLLALTPRLLSHRRPPR
jgi:hypothetical protein